MDIATIFDQINSGMIAFFDTVGDAFEKVVNLFYVSSGDNQGFTILGVLTLAGLGVGLAWAAYRLIKGAIKGVTKSN